MELKARALSSPPPVLSRLRSTSSKMSPVQGHQNHSDEILLSGTYGPDVCEIKSSIS